MIKRCHTCNSGVNERLFSFVSVLWALLFNIKAALCKVAHKWLIKSVFTACKVHQDFTLACLGRFIFVFAVWGLRTRHGFSFQVHYKCCCGQTSFPIYSIGSCWSIAKRRKRSSVALPLPQHRGEEWSTPGCATWHGKLQDDRPDSWEALKVKWVHHTPVSVGSRNTSFILGSCLCLHFPQFCLHWCYTDFFLFIAWFCFFFFFEGIKGKRLSLQSTFYLVVILELHLSVLIIFHNCEKF